MPRTSFISQINGSEMWNHCLSSRGSRAAEPVPSQKRGQEGMLKGNREEQRVWGVKESRARTAAQGQRAQGSPEQQLEHTEHCRNCSSRRGSRLGETGHGQGKLSSREGSPEEKVTARDKGSWSGKSWGVSVLGASKMNVQN